MSESFRIFCGEFGRITICGISNSITTHVHRMCHLLFKIDGPSVKYSINGKEYAFESDNCLLINAWEPHCYNHQPGDESITVLEIGLDRNWLASIDRRFSLCMHPKFFPVPTLAISDQLRSGLDDLTQLLCFCLNPKTEDIADRIREIVLAAFGEFAHRSVLSNHDVIGGLRCDPRIRKVLSLTEQAGIPCLTMEQMVKTAGISRPRFFQLFKRETNVTPHIFANMLRMENAIQLVSKETPSVADIAWHLGFESPGNFTRFFRNHQGITPIQYRRCASNSTA